MVLDTADVGDLLIPNYAAGDQGKLVNSREENSMYNIDVVQRILEYFLLYEQKQQQQQPGPLTISKLLDNYLAENCKRLPVTKFQFLAQSLPENAPCDDHERRRLCKVMNSAKLSLDACEHAAQNERLPLRTMIQVLFSEQVKIRATIQGKCQIETADNSDQESSGSSTNKEVKMLKIELEKVKMQIAELQRDYSVLQQEYQKQTTKRNSSGWTRGWPNIRKSGLFNLIIDREETDESENRPKQSRRNRFHRRQSIS
ncbi:UNVERIFIED_CONTAM: Root phototropism protein 3 [Sesamum radiatum]|uniref:Root phototropism protein 3 n=1 Tax=Sesamum radiatum TaxID=300843 RepID=A0AAW2P4D3_SESRA